MTVSTTSVRDLLDHVAAEHLSETSIQANIDRYKRIIDDVADPDASTAKLDDAIRAGAVWLSYGTYIEGITQSLGNISVADETKLDHFRKVAELFLNRISRERISLEDDDEEIMLPPEVTILTTSEAYSQNA